VEKHQVQCHANITSLYYYLYSEYSSLLAPGVTYM
jgi:hypothetical protein